MRIPFLISGVALAALAATAAAVAAAAQEPLTIGVYDNPPLSSVASDGRAVGLFPRLLETIADGEDWPIAYVELDFNSGLEALDDGRIDGLMAVAKTNARLRRFRFPREQVISNWAQIYAPNGNSVRTFLNLQDLVVAAVKADVYLEGEDGLRSMLDRLDVRATFRLYDSYRAAAQAVARDEADVALLNRFAAGAFAGDYALEATSVIFAPVELHVAFSKRSSRAEAFIADFDARLLGLKADRSSAYHHEIDQLLSGGFARRINNASVAVMLGALAIFAVALGFAWRFYTMKQRLERMALTDALTEAPNRRAFMDVAAREFRRRLRDERPLSVAMIDADRFKAINDSYGHDVGDLVLIDIVDTLRATLRASDAYGRIGGEEFGVLMPATDLADALRVGEKLRAAFADRELAVRRGKLRYTVSIGVAEASVDERSFDETLKRADEAVYRAKGLGRNRVEAG